MRREGEFSGEYLDKMQREGMMTNRQWLRKKYAILRWDTCNRGLIGR